jgi:WD40 repeat protein
MRRVNRTRRHLGNRAEVGGIFFAVRPAERCMFRPAVAMCAVLLLAFSVKAAGPKPLWELDTPAGQHPAPAWLGYSPDGKAIISVAARIEQADPPVYIYTLRVWDAASRKERFTAELGRTKTPMWGDDLVAFPTDGTILTGGHSLVTRSLADGHEISTTDNGGTAEFAVWSVRDLNETFHLNRESARDGNPVQLSFRSRANFDYEEGFTKRVRGDDRAIQVTNVKPPRTGLRTQSVAMNPGRNRLVASFRDETTFLTQARHSLVQYRINTIDEFTLEVVAEATTPHAGSVSALTFAQNGKTLATGSEDGTVCLWDVSETQSRAWMPRATIQTGDHRVVSVSFSADWRMLAAATWDGKKPNLYLIDADTGALLRSVKLDRELTTLAWSQDGTTLLTGGHAGKLSAWDVAALLK